jgi:hypothetical protein
MALVPLKALVQRATDGQTPVDGQTATAAGFVFEAEGRFSLERSVLPAHLVFEEVGRFSLERSFLIILFIFFITLKPKVEQLFLNCLPRPPPLD